MLRAVTSAFPLHRYTYQDYVWLEEESSTRHEFLAGEIVAIAGGTPEHAAMAAEVIGQLREQMTGKPCRVFTSDLGVRVLETGLATYPDASVVCGSTERDPQKKTNVTNPRLLLEVTSDSTEEYDRGEKLANYKRIPSLEVVVIVSHREPRIDVWSRAEGPTTVWSLATAVVGEKARLATLSCELDVDAIWRASREPVSTEPTAAPG
jgi:Uma2 family endonuclease